MDRGPRYDEVDMYISGATIEKLILAIITEEYQSFGDVCNIFHD